MTEQIKQLTPGDLFEYGGQRFVLLEIFEYEALCITESNIGMTAFRAPENGGIYASGEYCGSLLEQAMNGFFCELIRNGGQGTDFVEIVSSGRCTDLVGGRGVVKGMAVPLTLWQFGVYKEILKGMCTQIWWLITPYEDTMHGGNDMVWCGTPSMRYEPRSVSLPAGVRPAVSLKLDTLVHVDRNPSETEKTENRGLSNFSTVDLVKEVERRLDGILVQEICRGGNVGE